MNIQTAIIGGGASGLAACALLSKSGRNCAVIECHTRVGKKLISTGNGRCNLGHTPLEMSAYHGDVDFAESVFSDWRGAEFFFAEFGLMCRADSAGRLYPYSNTANSVLDTLRFACDKAEILTGTPCVSMVSKNGRFLINNRIFAEKVIWACGSPAGAPSPDFSILQNLGHSIVKPHPALCPVVTDKSLTRPLKGLRVRALCSAIVGQKVIKRELGEVQFNEGSLSGICIMNLSRLVRDYGSALTISLDLIPEFTLEELKLKLHSIPLTGLFHKRIAMILQKEPIETVKDWRFPVKGKADWCKTQVMSGGVPAAELNGDLSSKIHSNLYIIGETVNVDGDCGGYNLEWAWATAKLCTNALILS